MNEDPGPNEHGDDQGPTNTPGDHDPGPTNDAEYGADIARPRPRGPRQRGRSQGRLVVVAVDLTSGLGGRDDDPG